MKFSVLIPVYNAERYLAQCIESVLNQSYGDFELLLVNDGSTDGSAALCERYAAADWRVRLETKRNEGVNITRQRLLGKAQGEYILFLDADDYWDTDLLHTVSDALDKTHADIVIFRHRVVQDNGKPIYDRDKAFPEDTLFDECNVMVLWDKFVSSERLNTIWQKCIRRTVFDANALGAQLPIAQGEDKLQTMGCFLKASTVYSINDVLLNYRMSMKGHGRNFRKEFVRDYETVRGYIREGLDSIHAPEYVINHFYIAYIEGLMQFVKAAAGVCKLQEYLSLLSEIKSWDNYKNAEKKVSVSMVSEVAAPAYKLLRAGQYKRLYWTISVKLRLRHLIKKLLMR